MNREQKAAAIAEIAENINESQAIFAVDYRGISVPQVAELRAKLREVDASFRVVKNSLTERAADETGAADYARATQLLPFKGGLMDGGVVDAEQIRAISRLPSREVLYGQLVGIVASPISGLVRTLNALIGGLAVALGQVQEQKAAAPEAAAAPAAAPEAAAAPATTTSTSTTPED